MMKSIFNGIQWRELVAWLPVLGLLMVLSALPFGWSDYQRIGIYVLGIGYVADYSCNQRWKQFSYLGGNDAGGIGLLFLHGRVVHDASLLSF